MQNEILSIHTFRSWKIGSIYWAVLRRLRRLSGRASSRGRRPPGRSHRRSLRHPAAGRCRGPLAPAARSREPVQRPIACRSSTEFPFERPRRLMSRFAAAGAAFLRGADVPSIRPSYEIRPSGDGLKFRSRARRERYKDSLDDAARDALFSAIMSCADTLVRRHGPRRRAPFLVAAGREGARGARMAVVYDSWTTTRASRRTPRWWSRRRIFFRRRPGRGVVHVLERSARRLNDNVLVPPNASDGTLGKVGREVHARPVVGYFGAIATGSIPTSSPTSRASARWDFGSSWARRTRPTPAGHL